MMQGENNANDNIVLEFEIYKVIKKTRIHILKSRATRRKLSPGH